MHIFFQRWIKNLSDSIASVKIYFVPPVVPPSGRGIANKLQGKMFLISSKNIKNKFRVLRFCKMNHFQFIKKSGTLCIFISSTRAFFNPKINTSKNMLNIFRKNNQSYSNPEKNSSIFSAECSIYSPPTSKLKILFLMN